MRFGPNDEDAAFTAREALVKRFGGWLDARPEHRGAQAWDADFLLQWKWGYADGDYGTWTRGDVDEFLLQHTPRKLGASSNAAASIPQSIGAFMYFLADSGLLSKTSDPAEALAYRAMAQKRSFLDAMDDPANFSMGKRVLTAAGLDVDADLDQAALDAAMAEFNALSFEERGRILGIDDDGGAPAPGSDLPDLPVRRVPSADELAGAARDALLLRQVDALHTALGPTGIKLTNAGNASVADGKRLVELVGTADAVDKIRSSTALRELFGVLHVAQRAGAATATKTRLKAVDAWTTLDIATRWRRVVEAALDAGAATLQFGSELPVPWELADDADTAAFHFLAMLWIVGEPFPVDGLASFLGEASAMDPNTRPFFAARPERRAAICLDRAHDVVNTLTAAGVVEMADDNVTLTDAGAWAVGPILADYGFGALEADDITGLTSGELINLLRERNNDVATLVPLWVDDRDPAVLAEAIVETLLANPEPIPVVIGFQALARLGDAATAAVAGARDTAVAPQAWLFLSDAGVVDPSDAPREMVVKAGIDLFMATSELGSPADVVESLFGGQPVEEHASMIDEFATSDHPYTGDVLELFGRHHPDKPLAKHARKAAHRWRTARGSSG